MSVLCRCCEPDASATPRELNNRPSLSAVAYRIGTYANFRQAMLSRIAASPELARLTTRASEDYAITVLELWAAVSDVLTFYQERYANESYLGTAVYRDSVRRLANLIGYTLRPGVAATTSIAFTLDAGKRLAIPVGQKVQSVPEQGQQPQTFETLQAIDADSRLNRVRVAGAPFAGNPLAVNSTFAVLDRITGPSLAASLSPGDNVVLFNDGAITSVEEKKVAATAAADDAVALRWTDPLQRNTWSATTKAFRFRRKLRVFGHNAPAQYMVASTVSSRIVWTLTNLGSVALPAGNFIELDGAYEDLKVGGKLLVCDSDPAGKKTLVTIKTIAQTSATFGPMQDTVTLLEVLPDAVAQVPALTSRRRVVLYELEGAPLAFWTERYPATVSGDTVYIPGVAVETSGGLGIEFGRTVERGAYKPGQIIRPAEIVVGRAVLLEDKRQQPVAATVKAPPVFVPAAVSAGQFCHLAVPLDVSGTLALDVLSSVLLGNVAPASHGETAANELVGSGDASLKFQRLALRKSPLTYLAAGGASALSSTLDLRVGGARWREVPSLYGQPSNAPVFTLRLADDGTPLVQFGDGQTGAVLPTGRNNVTATYRFGNGIAGRVPARSLTTLLQKPAGLSAATNLAAAEGGADPEAIEDARRNAPRTVRTFGRIVSLEDFADQITVSGEVAKSLATWVWDGLDRAVHLTVAGQAGAIFSDDVRKQLGDNLRSVRDPNHRVLIDNYTRVYIELRAGIGIEPDYDSDAVLAAAHQAVVDALSFDALSLGHSVHVSDMYRVIQDVPGVRFVDIDKFLFKKPAWLWDFWFLILLLLRGAVFNGWTPAPVQPHLRIFEARPNPFVPGAVLPAELAAVEFPDQDIVIETREVA